MPLPDPISYIAVNGMFSNLYYLGVVINYCGFALYACQPGIVCILKLGGIPVIRYTMIRGPYLYFRYPLLAKTSILQYWFYMYIHLCQGGIKGDSH